MNSIHSTQPHSTPQLVSSRDAREPASNSNTIASRISNACTSTVRFAGRVIPVTVGAGVAAASASFATSLISATASRAGVGTSAIVGAVTGGAAGFVGGAAFAASATISSELLANRNDTGAGIAAVVGAATGAALGAVAGACYGAVDSFIEHH